MTQQMSELNRLEGLTRDYAAMQNREGGLSLALGGGTAMIFALLTLYGVGTAHPWLLAAGPLGWLFAKEVLHRRLYAELGTVRLPDEAARERAIARTIWGVALLLMLLEGLFLFSRIRAGMAFQVWNVPQSVGPWWHTDAMLRDVLLTGMVAPLALLLPLPWLIRGPQEGRIYAVLAVPMFLPRFFFSGGLEAQVFGLFLPCWLGFLLIWGSLALIRGLRRHRAHIRLVHSLGAVPAEG